MRCCSEDSAGALIKRRYEKLIDPATTLPTFLQGLPSETSPLARPHRVIVGVAERWDLVTCGMELSTA